MTLQLFCRRGESQAKKANHFGGCGESTSFTTKEQREAAELLLSWQAKKRRRGTACECDESSKRLRSYFYYGKRRAAQADQLNKISKI